MVALPAILSEMKMDKDGGWTVKFELSELSGEQIAQVTKMARHKAVMIGITGQRSFSDEEKQVFEAVENERGVFDEFV